MLTVAPTKETYTKLCCCKNHLENMHANPTFFIEITKLGIRRAPETNAKTAIWKVRVGPGQSLEFITSL